MKNSSLSDSNIHKKGTDHIAIQNISPHRRRQNLRSARPAFRRASHRSVSSGSFPPDPLPLGSGGNPVAAVRNVFEKNIPPIRSVGEWGAYPLIGLSIGLVPLLS